ncbi:hypothetical protein FACS1894132_04410 [Clostridia bacterium]|nr:hypothetical protein FACS1894132_04410 [Clostridia bacterium]
MKKIITILLSGMLFISAFPIVALEYKESPYGLCFLAGEDLKKQCIANYLTWNSTFVFSDGSKPTVEYLETLPTSFYEKYFGDTFRYGASVSVDMTTPNDTETAEKIVNELEGVRSWSIANNGQLAIMFEKTSYIFPAYDLLLENENVVNVFTHFAYTYYEAYRVVVPDPPVAEKLKTPTITNLVICSKYINDTVTPSKEDAYAYDLNSDGLVNGVDFSLLKRKLISQFTG